MGFIIIESKYVNESDVNNQIATTPDQMRLYIHKLNPKFIP